MPVRILRSPYIGGGLPVKKPLKRKKWLGRKDLNPRHMVLETIALPSELYPFIKCSITNLIMFVKKKYNKKQNNIEL